jgi:hypothetical protein
MIVNLQKAQLPFYDIYQPKIAKYLKFNYKKTSQY